MRRQRGFSLLELMLVLTLAMAIVGVATRYYVVSRANADGEALYTRAAQLRAAVEQAYPNHDYTDLTPAAMAVAPGVPRDLVAGTALVDVVAGTIGLLPATEGGASVANSTYTMGWSAVPKANCLALAQRLAPDADRLIIDGTVVLDVNAGTAFDRAGAITACAEESNNLSIRFRSL